MKTALSCICITTLEHGNEKIYSIKDMKF